MQHERISFVNCKSLGYVGNTEECLRCLCVASNLFWADSILLILTLCFLDWGKVSWADVGRVFWDEGNLHDYCWVRLSGDEGKPLFFFAEFLHRWILDESAHGAIHDCMSIVIQLQRLRGQIQNVFFLVVNFACMWASFNLWHMPADALLHPARGAIACAEGENPIICRHRWLSMLTLISYSLYRFCRLKAGKPALISMYKDRKWEATKSCYFQNSEPIYFRKTS